VNPAGQYSVSAVSVLTSCTFSDIERFFEGDFVSGDSEGTGFICGDELEGCVGLGLEGLELCCQVGDDVPGLMGCRVVAGDGGNDGGVCCEGLKVVCSIYIELEGFEVGEEVVPNRV